MREKYGDNWDSNVKDKSADGNSSHFIEGGNSQENVA